MRFLLSIGLLLAFASSGFSDPQCHMSELMSCAQIAIDWLHTLPPKSLPETDDDMETMCKEIGKALDCAGKFRDSCMTPMQKELLSLVIEGVLEYRKDFCGSSSGSRAKYLKHSVCLNKVSHMEEVKAQIEYILAVFEKSESVPQKDFINYACCGYGKFYNSFVKLGKDNCGKEAVDTVQELMGMAVAQLPEVVCSGFTGEEDKCKAILPPADSKPTDNAKGTAIYKFLRDVLKNWLD